MLDRISVRYLLAFLSCAVYALIGYCIDREETLPLFASFFLLFAVYSLVISRTNIHWAFWFGCSLLFRAILLFAVPALSDDFYRFIWDGRLIAAGVNPFAEVPSFYMQNASVPNLDASLFDQLNSQERYSSYPPVCQFVFWLSAALSPSSVWGSVVVMRSVLLIFELGTLRLLQKLISHFRLPSETILIYALNPLVILEITGNLHFEGVMIFFLLLAIICLLKGRLTLSIFSFALSVCTKLIPLMFLPLLVRNLGWRKAITYWIGTAVITLALFVPLLDTKIVHGFSTSLAYYFQKFEFNASIYYLLREAGRAIFGFNIIQFAGPALAGAAATAIFYISWRNLSGREEPITKNTFEIMLWCLLLYFLSTTILHPWYIITLLAISLFTTYRFPVMWTGLIFLTYAGYTSTGFKENYWFVALEYVLLFAMILFERAWKPKAQIS